MNVNQLVYMQSASISMRQQHYREGGWGWAVVLSAFTAEFINIGSVKALGVLITPMKEDFQTDLWIIGSINSLHMGLSSILTPVASAIAHKLGGRVVITVGGLVYGIGFLLSSLALNPATLLATLITAGSGAACTHDITRSEVAFYFREKYALVSFLVYTGAPVGMMLYGPMTQVLLHTYGWRGAMMLIGAIAFHPVCGGLLIRRPNGIYANIPSEDVSTDDDACLSEPHGMTLYQRLADTAAENLSIFLNLDFLLVAAARMCYTISLCGILVYMVPNALFLGLSPIQASFLTTAYGVGSVIGLLLSAALTQSRTIPLYVTGMIGCLITAVASGLEPFISSVLGQVVNMCVIAAGTYAVIQVISVLTRDLPFPDDRFVFVLGWLSFLSGVASAIGVTISGWLYDVTHSFRATFFIFGGIMLIGMLSLLAAYLRAVCNKLNN